MFFGVFGKKQQDTVLYRRKNHGNQKIDNGGSAGNYADL